MNKSLKRNAAKPVFKSKRGAYTIDSCRPQIKAFRQGLIEFHALTHGNYPGKPLPEEILPGLSSIGWWNAKGAPDWGLEAHRNEGLEIVFMETGSMPFIVDNRKYKIQSGNLTITRPWEEHKLGNPNIGLGRLHWLIIDLSVRKNNQTWQWPEWVILDKNDIHQLTKKLSSKKALIINTSRGMRNIFKSLSIAVASKGHGRFSAIAIYINELLLELLRNLQGEKSTDKPTTEDSRKSIIRFLAELENDVDTCAQPWTLVSMAEHCHVGATFFVERCREAVNDSPMKYLNDCRLNHADRMLTASKNKSVTDIAMACGFGSSQYFATCYRKKFSHPPSEQTERLISVRHLNSF